MKGSTSRSSFEIIRLGLSLLPGREALVMLVLFGAVSVVGILEAMVVALVVPLMQTIIQPDLLKRVGIFSKVSVWLGFEWSSAVFPYIAAVLAILIVASSLANLATSWLMDNESTKARNRLGDEIVKKLLDAPYLWFLTKNTAILSRQIFADIRIWRNDFLQSMMSIAQSAILIILPSLAAILLAPSYGLVALVIVGLLGIIPMLIVRPRIHLLVRLQKNNMDSTMRVLQQLLTGIREAKVTNRTGFFAGQFNKYHALGNRYYTNQRLLNQFSPALILMLGQVGFIATATIFWSSGLAGADITAQLAMLGVVVSRVLPTINRAIGHVNTLIASLPFVEALMNTLIEIDEAGQKLGQYSGSENIPVDWHSIRLESVSFRYPGSDHDSLVGLSISFERGKRYGVVGKSGSGKSTLVNLLLGLLYPTEGNVLVDGRPIHNFSIKQWRERLGYVPQDVFFLDDSLRANIAFGDDVSNIDQHRMEAAIENARLAGVIKNLPEGLDTQLGERGRRLSGGQGQRVAIARALYREPEVVLLDEATSALDSVTEKDIQASFDALGGNVLAIAVAHRVSSLRNCHSIIVLHAGQIQDVGTYDELLERNQLFRDLAARPRKKDAE